MYKKLKIDLGKEFSASYFLNDSTFNVIKQSYYNIKEKGKTRNEVGTESNIIYRINPQGKFIEIENKSFEKEYVKPYYKLKNF